MAGAPYTVELQVDALGGLPLPQLHGRIEALGSEHPVDFAGLEGGGQVALIGLGEAPRYFQLRLWCGEGAARTVCGELVHFPDSTRATRLDLQLEATGQGWELVVADAGPGPTLLLQAGLGVGLLVLVGVAALRRLGREG